MKLKHYIKTHFTLFFICLLLSNKSFGQTSNATISGIFTNLETCIPYHYSLNNVNLDAGGYDLKYDWTISTGEASIQSPNSNATTIIQQNTTDAKKVDCKITYKPEFD